jgi:hypothetical protein
LLWALGLEIPPPQFAPFAMLAVTLTGLVLLVPSFLGTVFAACHFFFGTGLSFCIVAVNFLLPVLYVACAFSNVARLRAEGRKPNLPSWTNDPAQPPDGGQSPASAPSRAGADTSVSATAPEDVKAKGNP